MQELIKEIRLQVYERTSSPLIGSFFVAWCMWNYKFLVILFSDASISTTFRLITEISFPSLSAVIWYGAVAPLISALAYIYIYPIPAKKVYEHWQNKQKEISEIRQRIEDSIPLTNEQSRQIRLGMSRQVELHHKELEIKDAEIDRLKKIIEDLGKRTLEPFLESPVEKSPKAEVYPITEDQLKLMEEMSSSPLGNLTDKFIASHPAEQRIKMEYDAGELVARGMAKRSVLGGVIGYELTHDGKGYLLKRRDKGA